MAHSIESTSLLTPTFYEEDSFEFLIFYQSYKDWIIYDSEQIGYDVVYSLATNFINFHGKIPFPEDVIEDSYWSVVPLGLFRYKMLQDGSYDIVDPPTDNLGYIVEGMYWFNGFFYLVKDNEKIIQIKLFIDSDTQAFNGYP